MIYHNYYNYCSCTIIVSCRLEFSDRNYDQSVSTSTRGYRKQLASTPTRVLTTFSTSTLHFLSNFRQVFPKFQLQDKHAASSGVSKHLTFKLFLTPRVLPWWTQPNVSVFTTLHKWILSLEVMVPLIYQGFFFFFFYGKLSQDGNIKVKN